MLPTNLSVCIKAVKGQTIELYFKIEHRFDNPLPGPAHFYCTFQVGPGGIQVHISHCRCFSTATPSWSNIWIPNHEIPSSGLYIHIFSKTPNTNFKLVLEQRNHYARPGLGTLHQVIAGHAGGSIKSTIGSLVLLGGYASSCTWRGSHKLIGPQDHTFFKANSFEKLASFPF